MDDLISRQAAIDAIRESTSKYTGFMKMEMYTDDDAVEAINGVPSAQPEPQWIPCSERNPDKNGIYLITITPKYLNGTAEVRRVYWSGRWAGYLKKEVLAWMPLPLPEPYKGEP